MYKFVQATYHNGNLVLSEKLQSVLDGETVKVLILDIDEDDRKSSFLSNLKKHRYTLPVDYRFDRDEIYDRSR